MSVITNCKSCGMEIFTNPPIKEMECEKCEENSELKEKLNRIKTLVIECDADNRVPQPYEIIDIINE